MNKAVNIPAPAVPDNFQWLQATHVILCPAIETFNIFLNHRHSSFPDTRKLLCIPIGFNPQKQQVRSYIPYIKNKKIILLMPDDLLGRVADIKVAAWLRNHDIHLRYCQPDMIQIAFKNKIYHFPEHKISLNALEKASAFRSKIRTSKFSLPEPNACSVSGPYTS